MIMPSWISLGQDLFDKSYELGRLTLVCNLRKEVRKRLQQRHHVVLLEVVRCSAGHRHAKSAFLDSLLNEGLRRCGDPLGGFFFGREAPRPVKK
jgi:hypothetical protein